MAKMPQLDPAAEEEGVWVNFYEDIEVLLCYQGNEFRQALARLERKNQRKMSVMSAAERAAEQEDMTKRVMSKYTVKGFRNLQNEEGEEEEYSMETALKYLRGNARFFEFCFARSRDMETFRQEDEEDDLGNL